MEMNRHAVKWISLLLSLLICLTSLPVSAGAEADADALASALLEEQAAKQTDPWVLAILHSGAKNASLQDGSLTFTLRSYAPDLKSLGSYSRSSDQAAWRKSMLTGLTDWNLGISVPVDAGGTPGKRAATLLLKAVKQAARNAKAVFNKQDVIKALTDLLWCSPTNEKKVTGAHLLSVTDEFSAFIESHKDVFPCESPVEWAPAFFSLKNWEIKAINGPEELSLSWQGIPCDTLVNRAYDEAALELAGTPASERLSRENLPILWRSSLANAAVSLAGGKSEVWKTTFKLDDLISGTLPTGYLSFFDSYKPKEALKKLTASYDQLPAEACETFPKTGVNTSAKRGRSVTVRVDKTGRNTYVQFSDADTGVIRGDAFIAPGKNVNIKIPEGSYIVRFASGSTWYGMNSLFGPMGEYTVSDPIIVAKPKWKLTAGVEFEGFSLSPASVEDFVSQEDNSVTVKASLEPTTPILTYPNDSPVTDGINPYTGLPSSNEDFTPVVMVLDNAEEAYPHWGVSQADIIFQIPNAGSGVTKLLALFGESYPDQAGPVRSGRASMLPVALSFDAAFAFAGPPAGVSGSTNVDLISLLTKWGMVKTHRAYNLLNSTEFDERRRDLDIKSGSHNLSCHISAIHENLLKNNVDFYINSFLFADEPRTDGETAVNIRVLHRGEKSGSASNSASRAVFNYDETTGQYSRTNSSGLYTDRDTGENVTFSNVIVLRVQFGWERGNVFLNDHMVGSGSAEIFQNGRYVRGAWVRTDINGRLILTDADGSELKLQRGRSFIIVTNDITDVIYTR